MSINATLVGQMITFALLVWFTMKYTWPPLFGFLEERKKKFADGLAAGRMSEKEIYLHFCFAFSLVSLVVTDSMLEK